MNVKEFEKIIKGRRSIRLWQEKKVPRQVIEKLIDAARYAPSSCDRQPLKFLVLEKKDDIEFTAGKTTGGVGFAHKAALAILVLADARVYSLPIERHTPYLDGAAAIQNLLLSAHIHGLGAVWLNWCTSHKSEEDTRKRFNIPEHVLPVSLIGLGYPAIKPPTPARKKISDLIEWNSFKQ